jgi:hypothetical protein
LLAPLLDREGPVPLVLCPGACSSHICAPTGPGVLLLLSIAAVHVVIVRKSSKLDVSFSETAAGPHSCHQTAGHTTSAVLSQLLDSMNMGTYDLAPIAVCVHLPR